MFQYYHTNSRTRFTVGIYTIILQILGIHLRVYSKIRDAEEFYTARTNDSRPADDVWVFEKNEQNFRFLNGEHIRNVNDFGNRGTRCIVIIIIIIIIIYHELCAQECARLHIAQRQNTHAV